MRTNIAGKKYRTMRIIPRPKLKFTKTSTENLRGRIRQITAESNNLQNKRNSGKPTSSITRGRQRKLSAGSLFYMGRRKFSNMLPSFLTNIHLFAFWKFRKFAINEKANFPREKTRKRHDEKIARGLCSAQNFA